jgi:hypothetical protein
MIERMTAQGKQFSELKTLKVIEEPQRILGRHVHGAQDT